MIRFHVDVFSSSSKFDYVTHTYQTGAQVLKLKEKHVHERIRVRPVRIGQKTMQQLRRVG